MDLFGEDQYQELDWLTKAIEPITDDLNDLLASLPEQLDFSIDDLAAVFPHCWDYRVNTFNLLKFKLSQLNIKIDDSGLHTLSSYFDITNNANEINFTTGEGGNVVLKKNASTMSEKHLKERLINVTNVAVMYGNHKLWDYFDENDAAMVERLREVLDVLDCKDGLRARSLSSKTICFSQSIKEKFREDKFKIRNVQLAGKVASWYYKYVETGDLSIITNICRLKVMAYNERPIYKFEETT